MLGFCPPCPLKREDGESRAAGLTARTGSTPNSGSSDASAGELTLRPPPKQSIPICESTSLATDTVESSTRCFQKASQVAVDSVQECSPNGAAAEFDTLADEAERLGTSLEAVQTYLEHLLAQGTTVSSAARGREQAPDPRHAGPEKVIHHQARNTSGSVPSQRRTRPPQPYLPAQSFAVGRSAAQPPAPQANRRKSTEGRQTIERGGLPDLRGFADSPDLGLQYTDAGGVGRSTRPGPAAAPKDSRDSKPQGSSPRQEYRRELSPQPRQRRAEAGESGCSQPSDPEEALGMVDSQWHQQRHHRNPADSWQPSDSRLKADGFSGPYACYDSQERSLGPLSAILNRHQERLDRAESAAARLKLRLEAQHRELASQNGDSGWRRLEVQAHESLLSFRALREEAETNATVSAVPMGTPGRRVRGWAGLVADCVLAGREAEALKARCAAGGRGAAAQDVQCRDAMSDVEAAAQEAVQLQKRAGLLQLEIVSSLTGRDATLPRGSDTLDSGAGVPGRIASRIYRLGDATAVLQRELDDAVHEAAGAEEAVAALTVAIASASEQASLLRARLAGLREQRTALWAEHAANDTAQYSNGKQSKRGSWRYAKSSSHAIDHPHMPGRSAEDSPISRVQLERRMDSVASPRGAGQPAYAGIRHARGEVGKAEDGDIGMSLAAALRRVHGGRLPAGAKLSSTLKRMRLTAAAQETGSKGLRIAFGSRGNSRIMSSDSSSDEE